MQDNENRTKKNVLFVHYGADWIRGSEQCLLDLLTNINRDEFNLLVWTNNPSLIRELDHHSIDSIYTDFTLLLGWSAPRYNVANYLSLIRQALSLIRSYSIDILHSNSAGPCQWMAPAARLAKVPLIAHLHSPYILGDRITLLVYQASICVGVSQYVVEPLLQDGLDKSRVRVIANGALPPHPGDDCNLKQELGLQGSETKLLVSIGSLIERKGLDIVIASFRALLEYRSDVHLAIIGDGPLMESLNRASIDIQDRVHFLGNRTNAARLLKNNADILVSGARQEAFGLVFLEAGFSEVPVVATNVGGVKEVVKNGETGILVEKDNPEEMLAAIQLLLQDSQLRKKMGQSALLRCRDKFTIKRYVDEFEDLYRFTYSEHDTIGWGSSRVPRKLIILKIKEKLRKLFHTVMPGHASQT